MPKPILSPGKGGGKPGKKNSDEGDPSRDGAQVGTEKNDDMVGTEGNDTMLGLAGDDTLNGWTGHNVMDGGEGSDLYLFYGRGSIADVDDSGTSGTDVIAAGTSSTTIALDGFGLASGIEKITADGHALVDIAGSAYGDNLDFSATELDGIHMIHGMGGDDTIVGSDSADMVAGGAGDDVLGGGDGLDTLNGGNGADRFMMSATDDSVDVIADFDATEGDSLDLTSFSEDESVIGWEISSTSSDAEETMATLQILYEGGQSRTVAEFVDFHEESFDEDAILLF